MSARSILLHLAAVVALCGGCGGDDENVLNCDVVSDCPHGYVACEGGRCLKSEELHDGAPPDASFPDAAPVDRSSPDAPELDAPGDLATWLLMDHDQDLSQPLLVVRGAVDVGAPVPGVSTAGHLTHGRIDLYGDLTAAGEAWAIDRGEADAPGTTVHLLGEGVTVDLTDPGPAGCRFADVVAGGEVTVVGEGMYIDGDLRVTGALTVAGPIIVTGDLDATNGVVRAGEDGAQPWLDVRGAVLGGDNVDHALLTP